MKIFGLMMVRNEADILRVNLLHHLAAGIDRFLVVDNGSSDGSDQILREMSGDGRVSWTRDDGKYRQAEITTGLAHEARSAGADWVIPIDVDEFWHAPGGNLRRVLEESSASALKVQVTNFVQRRDQMRAEPGGLLHMTRRAPIPVGDLEWTQNLVEKNLYSYVEVTFAPKWISRAADSLEIAMGNHGIAGASGRLEATDEIVCLHAPLRARSILDSKVEQGRRVAALGLNRKHGWHVQRWTRLAEQNQIDAEWLANSYEGEFIDVYGAARPVVYDPRLRDVVRPWVEQGTETESQKPAGASATGASEAAELKSRVLELEQLQEGAASERLQLLKTIQMQLSALPDERTRSIEELTQQVIERDGIARDLQEQLQTEQQERTRVVAELQAELDTKIGQGDREISELRAQLARNTQAGLRQAPGTEAALDHSVAFVPWGDRLIEEVLDPLGLSLENLRDELRAGWVFAYIDALKAAGVRCVVFFFSARLTRAERFAHRPTGAEIIVLPSPRIARWFGARAATLNRDSAGQGFGHSTCDGNKRPGLAGRLGTPMVRLAREIRRQGCEAVLCGHYESARFGTCVLLGRMIKLPVFGVYQGAGETHWGRGERIRRRALENSSGLIVSTLTETQRLRLRYRLPPGKLARVGNPVAIQTWERLNTTRERTRLGIPAEASVAVWHGVVEIEEKGLDILLEAWESVCQDRPGRDLRLFLLGTGRDAKELGLRIEARRAAGIDWRNEFLLDRDEVRRYLSAADVYVLASRCEGFPVALLEAMACGLPVVAADAAGVPDILEGGESSGGVLVSDCNPRNLAQELGRVLDDKQLAAQLGRNASRRSHSLSHEAVGRRLRKILFEQSGQDTAQNTAGADSMNTPGVSDAPLLLCKVEAREQAPAANARASEPAILVTAEHATRGTLVSVAGQLIETAYVNSRSLTGSVPRRLLNRAKRCEVYLTDGSRESNRIDLPTATRASLNRPGEMDPAESSVENLTEPIILHRLSPPSTQSGAAFNLQPGGVSALSIQCERATSDTKVLFGDTPLSTTFGGPTWVSAEVPAEFFANPGEHWVSLKSAEAESNRVRFIVE